MESNSSIDDVDLAQEQPKPRKNEDEEQTQHPGCIRQWEKAVDWMKKPILRAIIALSHASAMNPKFTIVVTLVISISFGVMGLFTNFKLVTDGIELWTPIGCRSEQHYNYVNSEEVSGFPTPPRIIRMLVHHRDKNNVLTLEGSRALFEVVDTVRQTKGYDETCYEVEGDTECSIMSATSFYNHNKTLFYSQVHTDASVRAAFSPLTFPDGNPVIRYLIFGYPLPPGPELPLEGLNVTTYTDDYMLSNAKAYFVEVSIPPKKEDSMAFELTLTDSILGLRDKWKTGGSEFVVEIYTERSFDDELVRGVNEDIPFMVVAFIIMGIFCFFCLYNRHDQARSHGILGLGGAFTVLLSIIASYGLLFLCGVPMTSVSQVFPYVMIGIGLDDTFILTGALDRKDNDTDIVERIDIVVEETGITIATSKLTTLVAFSLGCMNTLPAVRWFSYYAAPTVLIDFIYQITFFVALVVLDDRRIKANQYDLLCFQNKKPQEHDLVLITTNSNDNNDRKDPFYVRMMRCYGNILLKPFVKVVVIVAFVCMAGAGAYVATLQKQEMDFVDLTPTDSFVRDYFDSKDEVAAPATDSFLQIGAYFRDVDFSTEETQQSMLAYVDDMVNLPYVSSPPRSFWLVDFNQFVEENDLLSTLTFKEQIAKFLQTPPYSEMYKEDIVLDKNGNMAASRTYIAFDQNVSLYSVPSVKGLIEDRQAVSAAQPVNQGKAEWPFFTFAFYDYIWENYSVIVSQLLQTLVLGLVSIFVISAIVIPHPISPILLTAIVAAIFCDLVGFLYLVGVYINAVSTICLILCIGLVIDYNIHVLLAYFDLKGMTNRDERVKQVLETIGTSVFLGGFTTFLSILPLSLSQSLTFQTFFYAFLGVPLFGILHGLMLLPVILSIIGPIN